MTHRRIRVFLDASVVVAAMISARGGSAAVIDLARSGHVDLCCTETVLVEAYRSLAREAGQPALRALIAFIIEFKLSVWSAPTESRLHQYDELMVDPDDRHVLAGAARTRADILLTLDQRHFMTETLRAAKLPFRIQTPGEFLADLRSTLET